MNGRQHALYSIQTFLKTINLSDDHISTRRNLLFYNYF